MQKFDVIIVGAGASGMMAAITAAEKGKKVLLIEKMEQPARKLRITGKGRCNITNTKPLPDFLAHVEHNNEFLKDVFTTFFSEELMLFFKRLSLPLTVERGNRVFPTSNKAQDVFFALIKRIEKLNIKVIKNASVNCLLIQDKKVEGVELKNKSRFFAPNVILATGGKSYPLTGSTGDGYRMAKEAGHTIINPVPALVPLVCKEPIPYELNNFPLKNIKLTVLDNNTEIFSELGEITFTKNGISGPLVLTVSRKVARNLLNGKKFSAIIDFKPALNGEKLHNKLVRELNENSYRSFKDALRLWLPGKLQNLALQNIDIPERKPVSQLTTNDIEKIKTFLKTFSLTITATRGFDEAIITQGGICVNEVNSKTMESKIIKGLFFAGEIMDLDADTGGYNLQIAFSTGYVAGNNV